MRFQRSKPTKNGGHIPPSTFQPGLSSTLLRFENPSGSRSTVIYEPTTIPFVIRVPYLSTLFILPSLSLSLSPLLLYFSISYRAVPRGTEISLMPRRDLFHSFLPRAAHEHLSRIPARYRSRDDARYKSRGLGAHRAELANLGSRANFGPRSTLHLPPNRFDKRNLRGEIRIKERLVRGR